MITPTMDQIKISKSSPDKKDSPKYQDTNNVVPYNKKYPPLEGGHSTKIGGIWNIKHEIRSPKFYEILIKTELKRDTDLELKNFYNYIKMFINAATIIQ